MRLKNRERITNKLCCTVLARNVFAWRTLWSSVYSTYVGNMFILIVSMVVIFAYVKVLIISVRLFYFSSQTKGPILTTQQQIASIFDIILPIIHTLERNVECRSYRIEFRRPNKRPKKQKRKVKYSTITFGFFSKFLDLDETHVACSISCFHLTITTYKQLIFVLFGVSLLLAS